MSKKDANDESPLQLNEPYQCGDCGRQIDELVYCLKEEIPDVLICAHCGGEATEVES